MPRLVVVRRRMLAWRIVATSDVPALRASAQVKPPAPAFKAFHTTGAARRGGRIDPLDVRGHGCFAWYVTSVALGRAVNLTCRSWSDRSPRIRRRKGVTRDLARAVDPLNHFLVGLRGTLVGRVGLGRSRRIRERERLIGASSQLWQSARHSACADVEVQITPRSPSISVTVQIGFAS